MKTTSAYFDGKNLIATDGRLILCGISGFTRANEFCRSNGYQIRLAGTSMTSELPKILAELKVLDDNQ